MKYFLDTEFIERGADHPIELISIGIVSEVGHEFYAISSEFDESHTSPWVKENVLPQLGYQGRVKRFEIALGVKDFVSTNGLAPEFWGYYADYDWVVFCQLFGAMIDLPKGWPMYCRDLKQWCDMLGNPRLPAQNSAEHNALADARWNLQVYQFLAIL